MAASIAGCVAQLLQTGGITQQQANNVLGQQQAAAQAGVPNPAQVALANARQALTRQKYLAALQAQVIGLGRFVEKMPECPGDGSYVTGGDAIPPIGTLYFNCTLAAANKHEPVGADDW